jgi:hypothetical protein
MLNIKFTTCLDFTFSSLQNFSNMKSKVITLASFMIIISIFSCQKEQALVNSQFSNVDPELWTYYSSFEAEAAQRGLEYDLNTLQISGEIKEIHEDGVAGSCKFGSHINNEVTIDKSFWNNSSDLYKEFVVFHELGHCVLLRDHEESADGSGRCLSIMRSGLTNCKDSYTLQNRKRFLDELFFRD